jgi:hypothetical protein
MELTSDEKTLLEEVLNNEYETLGNSSKSINTENTYKQRAIISKILDKLNGGCGTVWMNTEEKIKDLLKRHNRSVVSTAESMCKSGALDVGRFNHNEWAFSKILITASLIQHCNMYAPMDGDDLKNLENF